MANTPIELDYLHTNEQQTVANPIEPVVMWLVECGINYEGSWPIGVYSSLERAEKSKKELNGGCDYINITKITLDEDIDT